MITSGELATAHQTVLAAGGGMGATGPVVGLVIGIVCAFACYTIANGKGRSGVLFGILGFFFSLITLIVVLVIPRKR